MSGAGILGVVAAGGLLYSASILIKPRRGFSAEGSPDIVAQVTIEEQHQDDVQITDHPVEQGANITDHAFELPATLTVRYGWSDSPSANNLLGAATNSVAGTKAAVQSLVTGNQVGQSRDIYEKLLKLKKSRVPFTVYTGKRKYKDMLIRSISVVTDHDHEHSFIATVGLRQVLLATVSVSSVSAPSANQANPQLTAAPVDSGTKQLNDGTGYDPSNGGKGF
jgi:hypothetical protein